MDDHRGQIGDGELGLFQRLLYSHHGKFVAEFLIPVEEPFVYRQITTYGFTGNGLIDQFRVFRGPHYARPNGDKFRRRFCWRKREIHI